ncbi:MAG: hypothetical protein HQL37_12260 [Alphaproteobacteria bacterium]|nr:hypothetical protein [Alphaproteobacteria bacterium]
MTTCKALVTQSATDDPETEWFFYSAGYELAAGPLAHCLAEAMSFGNNCGPFESAEVVTDDGLVVWRYRGPELVPSQFKALTAAEIGAAIAAATALGWAGIGERQY